MSQRKYKVRFRSDMRKEDSIQLNRRSRCPKPETIGSKDSTIIRCMNCMNCNDCQTSSPIASTDHQMECDLNGVENTSTLNEGENPPGLEDAAILLAFSAGDTSNEFSCDDPSNPVSPFISQERSHRRNPQEDSSTNPSHQQCNLILNPSSSSPITKTTPQLTFQTDILPNIPRALSSFSSWYEAPSSDKRFYLQYCKPSSGIEDEY